MKKSLFFTAVLLLAVTFSYGQTQKGDQTLGLNLGFSYNNNNGEVINTNTNSSSDISSKTTSFDLGPVYSYFIADKLDLGTSLSYSTSVTKYPPVSGYTSRISSGNLGGIVYLRKYCMFLDKVGIRTGPYVGYNHSDSKTTYTDLPNYNQETKTNYYNAGMRLELVYFPFKRLGFSTYLVSLDYNHYTTDSGASGHSKGDNLYLNLINNNLAVSAFYAFGK